MSQWLTWALLSACFAALTAIFAKVGVQRIDPDVATWLRTCVVLVALGILVGVKGGYRNMRGVPLQTYCFLVLSGLATGASWLCYFRALASGDAARVAPVDKLSVVLVAIFGVTFLGEKLGAANWVGVGLVAFGAWLIAIKG